MTTSSRLNMAAAVLVFFLASTPKVLSFLSCPTKIQGGRWTSIETRQPQARCQHGEPSQRALAREVQQPMSESRRRRGSRIRVSMATVDEEEAAIARSLEKVGVGVGAWGGVIGTKHFPFIETTVSM